MNTPSDLKYTSSHEWVRSEADGHTLLFGVFSHAVAPAVAQLTYDTSTSSCRRSGASSRPPKRAPSWNR